MHDVVIIGGGPAGAVAAIVLARLGRQTLLIEQRRFPREKVCGECLSHCGIHTLHQLQIAPAIQKLKPTPLHHAVIHSPAGSSCEIILPRPMWGISRHALDDALLQCAKDAGAEIRQPARCEAIEPGLEPAARIRDLSDNTTHRIAARWIILADGKAALLPRRPAPTHDLGVKATFQGIDAPPNTIELFGVRGHYGGLAPIENGFWNAAFSLPESRLPAHNGDLDAMMRNVANENPALSRRLITARRIGRWMAAPLPRFSPTIQWPRNVIPIGNAAAAIEPIGGEGMGLALRSGFLSANFIDTHLRGSADLSAFRAELQALWQRRRIVCRAMAMMLSSPPAARVMVAIASASQTLPAAILRQMGKSDMLQNPLRMS